MSAPQRLPGWDELALDRPIMVATMRAYLAQIACTLRPGSVGGTDLALRSFATFLAEGHRDVVTVAAVSRIHIEGFNPGWRPAPDRTSQG